MNTSSKIYKKIQRKAAKLASNRLRAMNLLEDEEKHKSITARNK